jgi:hypothetical protein
MLCNEIINFLYENIQLIKMTIKRNKILGNYYDRNCMIMLNNNFIKIKKMLRYKLAYFIKCYDKCQLSLSKFVLKNLRTIELMNSSVNNVIICKIFNIVLGHDVNLKIIAPQIKNMSHPCDTYSKYTEMAHRFGMHNIFSHGHDHTFFEILLLTRIIIDTYAYQLTTKNNAVSFLECINMHNLMSYDSFKKSLSNKLNLTCLVTNIEFIKKMLLVDNGHYETLNISRKLRIELTEYIYDYELKNDCVNKKDILEYGPFIATLEQFIFFMDKHKTSKICEFVLNKKDNDILSYALSVHGIDLIDVSRIFNFNIIDMLMLMNDNKLIDENKLTLLVNDIVPSDKFLKYVAYDKQIIDINFMRTLNDLKKVSREIKIIGKQIFDCCVICMDKFTCYSNDKLMRMTCCNKLMHKKCATEWKLRQYQSKCPICCTKINIKRKYSEFDCTLNYLDCGGSWMQMMFPGLYWLNEMNRPGRMTFSN